MKTNVFLYFDDNIFVYLARQVVVWVSGGGSGGAARQKVEWVSDDLEERRNIVKGYGHNVDTNRIRIKFTEWLKKYS